MNIERINLQTHNGVPFMYGVTVIDENGTRKHKPYNNGSMGTGKPLVSYFPMNKLPQNVIDFIISPYTIMEWFGSSGDDSMYIIKKAC